MFSEYASRFLAQSQSRLPHPDSSTPHRNQNRADRYHRSSRPSASRSHLHRPSNMGNPYHPSASHTSRFAFASRTSNAPAPLFYSATDEFREEDDGEEHERELAETYALQQSRRQFGASHLTESSNEDDDGIQQSGHSDEDDSETPGFGRPRGIRSSWTGGKAGKRGRSTMNETITEGDEREHSVPASEASARSSKGKGKLVDVELASTVRGSEDELDDEPSGLIENDDYPPAFQQFRKPPPLRTTLPIPQETDEEALLAGPRPISPDRETVPDAPEVIQAPDGPKHDPFWAQLFMITKASLLGCSFLVWLFTEESKRPIGQDTIYTVLHASFRLLAVYSLVSVIVGSLWLALLRSFVRPLVYVILVSVPSVLFSFWLYPFISSYQGSWEGHSSQDKAMRWFSFLPLAFAVIWVYCVWKARLFLNRSIELLEFTGKVLAAEPPLILVGFATLAVHILYSWLWILLFTRLFLEGHFQQKTFIIPTTTWWLGVAYVIDYLWTMGVISGIQRCTTAATVSTWYFHRNAVPAPSPRAIVTASLTHAIDPMLGPICLFTFLSLAIRLPLLVLPPRLARLLTSCLYTCFPTPLTTVTNPLALTTAAVHSLPLLSAARHLSHMQFISSATPTTTLGPRTAQHPGGLTHYRLTKLLLHAIRYLMALALGYGGWVATARQVALPGVAAAAPHTGSAYAYVIGLLSAALGWGVLGAVEGVVGTVLDALVVCWAAERGAGGVGEVRYCREAGAVFGDGGGGGGGGGGDGVGVTGRRAGVVVGRWS